MHEKHNSWGIILTLLGLLFITLKLTEVISWSWWWVLSPIGIPLALGLGFLVLSFALGLGFALVLHLVSALGKKL